MSGKTGKRSTPNAQRSTFKGKNNASLALKVESWKLNVERLPIDIKTTARTQLHDKYILKHLQAAHRYLRPALKHLSIALVGDKKMSALHLQFLSIPGPTDVLTFPLELDRKGRPLTGEVVICVPEAWRRCRTTHKDLRKELLLYALHGLLHLCGFDDRTDRGFKRMHRMEDKILNQLGVGAVYELGKDAG